MQVFPLQCALSEQKRRWGIGHHKHRQLSFQGKPHWQFRYNHGGILRQKRRGRKARPLSTRYPLHLVFKADKTAFKKGLRSPLGFAISQRVLKKYAKRFFVKLEQVAICQDHIHCLVRLSKRSLGQHFFRVVAGQIAQEFQKNGLMKVTDTPADGDEASGKPTKSFWRYRPFTRVIKGYRPYQRVRSYIQLNEREARGEISYRKSRLRGLSSVEWELLWQG